MNQDKNDKECDYMNLGSSLKRFLLQTFRGAALTNEQLRKKGLTVGKNVDIYTSLIDYEHGYLISIGDNVTIASDVRLLTHDASTKKILGYSKIGRIQIGNNVFIGAQSIILPNVNIGNNVIIGAGSVVTKDIPDQCVAVGNPCHVIGNYDDYIQKSKRLFENAPRSESSYPNKTSEEKEQMKKELKDGGWGFDL